MRRAIITGPTGAIGIALIEELVKNNVEVTAVCHCNSNRIKHIPKSPLVHVIECNLDQILTLKDKLSSAYDIFYHLAWAAPFGKDRNDLNLQLKNVQATLNAVDLADSLMCSTFIGAGTQCEYGRTNENLSPNTITKPENGYGAAKLCAGHLSRIRCQQLGIKHIWTRILSIYGPYDGRYTMIMSIIETLLNGKIPSCTKGEQLWDYLYSKDAGRALYLLGRYGQNEKTYCIGSGNAVPLSDYITKVRDIINPHLPIGFGEIPYSEKQVMHLCADISDLINDTGFTPEYSFEEGISHTIKWMKDELRNEENQYINSML